MGRLLQFFRNLDDARAAEKDVLYELLGGMNMITEKIKSCCGGRHVFTTQKGYIGLCPPLTKPGDLIYVLPGLHVPILLRAQALSELKLVSSCVDPRRRAQALGVRCVAK